MKAEILKQFNIIVRLGSITKAAKHLNLTQPTLTRSVKILEGQVGEPILKRTRYGVRPTEIGLRLATIGERIDDETKTAIEIIKQWQYGHTEIQVGIDPLLNYHIMDNYIATYYESNPQHLTQFITSTSIHFALDLQQRKLDFVLGRSVANFHHAQFTEKTIFYDEIKVLVGKKSKFYGQKKPIDLQDLNSERWVSLGQIYDTILTGKMGILPKHNMIFTGNMHMVGHLLQVSDVVVRMPVRLMQLTGVVTQDNILNTEEPHTHSNISIFSNTDATSPPPVRAVKNSLVQYFQHLDKTAPR